MDCGLILEPDDCDSNVLLSNQQLGDFCQTLRTSTILIPFLQRL